MSTHLGVDHQAFFPQARPIEGMQDVLLFVGQRDGYKRFDLAMQTVRRQPRLRLGIVGPRLSEAERDALRSNLGSRWQECGPVDQPTLRGLYSSAFAFVFPTVTRNSATTVGRHPSLGQRADSFRTSNTSSSTGVRKTMLPIIRAEGRRASDPGVRARSRHLRRDEQGPSLGPRRGDRADQLRRLPRLARCPARRSPQPSPIPRSTPSMATSATRRQDIPSKVVRYWRSGPFHAGAFARGRVTAASDPVPAQVLLRRARRLRHFVLDSGGHRPDGPRLRGSTGYVRCTFPRYSLACVLAGPATGVSPTS